MPAPTFVTTAPQVARASAALAAAGAWDAAPTELYTSTFETLLVMLSYTRGAAGGAFDFRVEVSPYSAAAVVPAGAAEWIDAALYAAGLVAAGADTTSLIQGEIVSFQAVGAAQEAFSYGPMTLAGHIERVRIPCRESGVVLTPGTLQVTIIGG